jgi:hypothetical protein
MSEDGVIKIDGLKYRLLDIRYLSVSEVEEKNNFFREFDRTRPEKHSCGGLCCLCAGCLSCLTLVGIPFLVCVAQPCASRFDLRKWLKDAGFSEVYNSFTFVKVIPDKRLMRVTLPEQLCGCQRFCDKKGTSRSSVKIEVFVSAATLDDPNATDLDKIEFRCNELGERIDAVVCFNATHLQERGFSSDEAAMIVRLKMKE